MKSTSIEIKSKIIKLCCAFVSSESLAEDSDDVRDKNENLINSK